MSGTLLFSFRPLSGMRYLNLKTQREREKRAAQMFPSPLGDEVLKPLYYDTVQPDMIAFPSPLGDEVLKPLWKPLKMPVS